MKKFIVEWRDAGKLKQEVVYAMTACQAESKAHEMFGYNHYKAKEAK